MAYGLPDWLTGSSNPASTKPKSADGGLVAPDRTNRERCYESRDIFFQCLDRHDILDAIDEDAKSRKVCPQEVTAYEKDCARSWIKYFKEKRVQDWKRDMTIKRIQEDDAKMAAKAKADKAERASKNFFNR